MQPIPEIPQRFNLADYFLYDRLEEGMGGLPAILWGDTSYTYAETVERSRALAAFLGVKGLKREERVLIILPDTPAFAWGIFACLEAGGVLAMGNPNAPVESLSYLVSYTRASVVITLPEVARSLESELSAAGLRALIIQPEAATGEPVESVDVDLDGISGAISVGSALAEGRQATWSRPETLRDDVAIWLFTSGSTGKPKAAVHSHRDFAFNTERYAKRTVGYRQGDITVSVPRLFFGYATGTNLWFPFAVGATVGLFAERPTPERLAEAIMAYRPSIVTNVPTMMSRLLEYDQTQRDTGDTGLDMSCVRFHLSAGEALPPALLDRFRARWACDVYDGIGSAEMFHIYCSNRPGDIKPGSLGRVVDGYELRILARDAEGPGAPETPVGETGVLWVKGDSVAHGYFQDREKSWKTFHGHWCRTGDLFRRDADGYLYFSGRADDLLKVHGRWLAPLEVETCLTRHPAVSLAALIGSPQGEGLVLPKAFVVLRDDYKASAGGDPDLVALSGELKTWVKDQLAPYKYPRKVAFLDDLPRNDRGKVSKKALLADEVAGRNPEGV